MFKLLQLIRLVINEISAFLLAHKRLVPQYLMTIIFGNGKLHDPNRLGLRRLSRSGRGGFQIVCAHTFVPDGMIKLYMMLIIFMINFKFLSHGAEAK